MNNVIEALAAIASTIDNSKDEQSIVNMYEIASNQMESDEQAQALKYGTLALLSDVGKKRIKRWIYYRKFAKSIKKLQGDK